MSGVLTPEQIKNTVPFQPVEASIYFEWAKLASGNENLEPSNVPLYAFSNRTADLLYYIYSQLDGATKRMKNLIPVLLFFYSCTTAKHVVRESSTLDSIVYTIDTLEIPVYLPAETTALEIQLEAYRDSLGICRIKQTAAAQNGNRVAAKVLINDTGKLTVNCECKEYKDTIQSLTNQIRTYRQTTNTEKTTITRTKNILGHPWLLVCFSVLAFIAGFVIRKKLQFLWPV